MINLKYSNNSIFIQFDDGEFILQECTKEIANQIKTLVETNFTKEEIFAVLDPEFQKLLDEVTQIREGNELVENFIKDELSDDRFYIENGAMYRKEIPISIPSVLTDKLLACMKEGNTEELNKLDKFWSWTSLIRNAESRNSFYSYISKNNLPITKEGFVVAFRRAYYNGSENSLLLQAFVTQEYLRLRKNKKSTNVSVYRVDNDYTLKDTLDGLRRIDIGNLKDLYLSFSDSTDYYESNHTNSKGAKVQYRIGKETIETDVDWSDAECSKGLHISNGGYDFRGYGDTALAVVINPMNVVHCPYADHKKMRVSALMPIAVLEEDCDFELTPEIEDMIDEMFHEHVNKLSDLIAEGNFAEDGVTHTLLKEVPEINFDNLLGVIKETVTLDVVKTRYTKV